MLTCWEVFYASAFRKHLKNYAVFLWHGGILISSKIFILLCEGMFSFHYFLMQFNNHTSILHSDFKRSQNHLQCYIIYCNMIGHVWKNWLICWLLWKVFLQDCHNLHWLISGFKTLFWQTESLRFVAPWHFTESCNVDTAPQVLF